MLASSSSDAGDDDDDDDSESLPPECPPPGVSGSLPSGRPPPGFTRYLPRLCDDIRNSLPLCCWPILFPDADPSSSDDDEDDAMKPEWVVRVAKSVRRVVHMQKIVRPWFMSIFLFFGTGCELIPGGRISSYPLGHGASWSQEAESAPTHGLCEYKNCETSVWAEYFIFLGQSTS